MRPPWAAWRTSGIAVHHHKMTNILSRDFPAPTNWQDFERVCYDLYSQLWNTNDAELHGRTGQPQAGVDVYGTDRKEGKFTGVQCKGRDQGYGSALTAKELREEVEKAKTFEPNLEVFVVATTALNHVAIQKVAREISEEHKKSGLFEVRVTGWTTLKQNISNYPAILQKYFSDLAPFDVVSSINQGFAKTDEKLELIFKAVSVPFAVSEKDDPSDLLQVRITEIAKLIDDGSPVAAIAALERLWNTEQTTARNRYRIKANIGFAKLTLGQKEAAITDLRAAHAEDPEWAGARAILATAEYLSGNAEKAFEIARAVLVEDRSIKQAAAMVIEAAPDTMAFAEVESAIPDALKQHLDICLALGRLAADRGDKDTQALYLTKATGLRPEDWGVLAVQAEVLLNPIFAIEGIQLTHAVPAELVANLEKSIELLQSAWTKLKLRENARVGAYLGANLLSALELANRKQEFDLLLDDGLNVDPEFQPFLRRYAQRMVDQNDWPAARRALDTIRPEDLEPADRLFKVQALIVLGETDAALAEARVLEREFGRGRDAEVAAALQIEAIVKAGRDTDSIEEILERWPNSIVLRGAAHNDLPEADPRRTRFLDEIKSLVQGITNPGDRMHAAEALYNAGQFSDAADTYDGLYSPDRDSVQLHRALRSLLLSDRRKDARQLYESLSRELRQQPRYIDIGIAIYEYAGMLEQALAELKRVLLVDDSLRRRLHWINISHRLNKLDDVLRWLDQVTPDQVGMPMELMQLAIFVDRLLKDPKCFPLAYRALRAGYNDPDIHLYYMMNIVLMGSTARDGFPVPEVVGPDTAVLLSEKGGNQKLIRVLETCPDPRIERDEIDPDSELGAQLIGKRVGEEIEVPNAGKDPTNFVISEIRNKYLHANHRSAEDFSKLFPGNQAFGSFTIDESKGEEKFKPIFESAKRRGEHAARLMELYKQGRTPLMVMSRLSGVSPCDMWETVASRADIGLLVGGGPFAPLPEESKAVVDLVTLYGLTRLGIADLVRKCFDDLGVVQTTLDALRRLVDERSQEKDGERHVMAWDGAHYHAVVIGKEAIAENIQYAAKALEFAERLTLVPSEPTKAFPSEALALFSEDVDPCLLDTLYAAQGEKRILLSDDRPLRNIGVQLAETVGAWTQLSAMSGATRGKLTPLEYHEVVAALITANYKFTSFDCHNFIYCLGKKNWEITYPVEAFIACLAIPDNEPSSVIRVFADFIHFGWPQMPSLEAMRDVLLAILKEFRKTQGDRDLNQLIADVADYARARLRQNAFRALLMHELRNSSSLTPIDQALRPIGRVIQRETQPKLDMLKSVLVELDRAEKPS
jgi:cellulose synthase operon protein C